MGGGKRALMKLTAPLASYFCISCPGLVLVLVSMDPFHREKNQKTPFPLLICDSPGMSRVFLLKGKHRERTLYKIAFPGAKQLLKT